MSNKIPFYQIQKGLSDLEAAKRSNLDIAYYNKIKNGRIVPGLKIALRIARTLERSVHTLWDIEEE